MAPYLSSEFPQSILHSKQVPTDFCYAGEGVEAVYNWKPLNREQMSEI